MYVEYMDSRGEEIKKMFDSLAPLQVKIKRKKPVPVEPEPEPVVRIKRRKPVEPEPEPDVRIKRRKPIPAEPEPEPVVKIRRKKVLVTPVEDAEMRKMLSSYQEDGTLFGDYDSISTVTSAVYLYLLQKYNNNCYVYGTYYDKKYKAGVTFKDPKNDTKLKAPDPLAVGQVGNIIKGCIKRGIKLIGIPISRPGHANMLIYRVEPNAFEWFEPHGKYFKRNVKRTEEFEVLIVDFMNKLADGGYILKNPFLFKSSDVCPFMPGFQGTAERSWKELDGPESSGFCQMWSAWFLEMTLAFPEISGPKLAQQAYKIMLDMGPGAFARHISNYTKDIEKAIGAVTRSDFTYKGLRANEKAIEDFLQKGYFKLIKKQYEATKALA